jgi:NO-binding membrane sensor protein with MHYT domain
MLDQFFQLQALPADHYTGIYDLRLVVLSYMVAVFASYIALDLTGRLRDHNSNETASRLWLLGGAIAMGAGIWSMHFIGMLSFTIPGLSLRYDLLWTILSLVVAIFVSGFALHLLKRSVINVIHLAAGGIILGLGIASMHYTGMAGMLIALNIRYLPVLFLISILVAIFASEAAIWLALKSNTVILRFRGRIKLLSALIMGLAICGMHYVGMAASVFTPLCYTPTPHGGAMDPTLLSMTIAGVTFVILSIAFFASNYKEAMNQQQFENARQLGMAEISASVLHNVGNILNSVNVSVETLSEKNKASHLEGLEKLSTLLSENNHNLAEFLTKDPRGTRVTEFIQKLSTYWREEQQLAQNELGALHKNLRLIQDTISTQQSLSKTTQLAQILSINELLDEALLITGASLKKEITIEKHYAKISVILADKVNLLQVVVNLLGNAKDALLESPRQDKRLIIKTALTKDNKILVTISDNGIGIAPANIRKIFHYGFTTKKAGHGFGLHAGALAINALGGQIHAESDGPNMGATFSLTLPYTRPK